MEAGEVISVISVISRSASDSPTAQEEKEEEEKKEEVEDKEEKEDKEEIKEEITPPPASYSRSKFPSNFFNKCCWIHTNGKRCRRTTMNARKVNPYIVSMAFDALAISKKASNVFCKRHVNRPYCESIHKWG